MSGVYTLYGSYASYHTAKTRSYLRKKGIPFVERVPGVPRFREVVRKQSDNHRIPQLEMPSGEVVQDSIAIFDTLETLHPTPPAYPPGVRQQLVARLLEYFIDATLGKPAWHYRWNFKDENYSFVGREFGRSFKPYGSDEELTHYGNVIAERMEGKRAALGDSPELRPVFEAIYLDALEILDEQFREYPYLFGGLPSIADHILMGPVFGHLARDPVPANLMKLKAPRLYRWTEHMNTPELASPEQSDIAEAYLEGDEVPAGTLKFLGLCLEVAGDTLVQSMAHYNEWAAQQGHKTSGERLSDDGLHEPVVARFTGELRSVPSQENVLSYNIWVVQRILDWLASLEADQRKQCRALLEQLGTPEMLDMTVTRRLTRDGTYMAFA